MKYRFLILFLVLGLQLQSGTLVEEYAFRPSERLVERTSWETVSYHLREMGISEELFPFFAEIAIGESWGHIGYHGANQGYRIYQDIIRFTVEEILGIGIRENFHFLRIPGDPDLLLASVEEFEKYWKGKVNNRNAKRAKQLLSLNYSIYSNYDRPGSSSLNLFVNDFSKTYISYEKSLAPFFLELGIDPKFLKVLFRIGQKWLNEESGILLRIAEVPSGKEERQEVYALGDKLCYPAKVGGYRFSSAPISSQFATMMSEAYLQKRAEIAPQLRLLVNNQETLNPFSRIVVERWDFYDAACVRSYEEEMRSFVRKLQSNSKKVERYRTFLLKVWSPPLVGFVVTPQGEELALAS